MNNGLYERPGVSATAWAAAWARRLEDAATKVSKMKRGSKETAAVSRDRTALAGPGPPCAPLAGAAAGVAAGRSSSALAASGGSTTWSRAWTSSPETTARVSSIRGRKRLSTRSRTTALGTPRTMTPSWKDTGSTPDSHICHVVSETCSRSDAMQRVHSPLDSFTCSSANLSGRPSTAWSTGVEHALGPCSIEGTPCPISRLVASGDLAYDRGTPPHVDALLAARPGGGPPPASARWTRARRTHRKAGRGEADLSTQHPQ